MKLQKIWSSSLMMSKIQTAKKYHPLKQMEHEKCFDSDVSINMFNLGQWIFPGIYEMYDIDVVVKFVCNYRAYHDLYTYLTYEINHLIKLLPLLDTNPRSRKRFLDLLNQIEYISQSALLLIPIVSLKIVFFFFIPIFIKIIYQHYWISQQQFYIFIGGRVLFIFLSFYNHYNFPSFVLFQIVFQFNEWVGMSVTFLTHSSSIFTQQV